MKSTTNTNDNWLGFSLSPHSPETTANPSPANPTSFFTLPSNFNYYYGGFDGVNNGGLYSSFPIMPLKSDGSLCLMDNNITSSQGTVTSSTPKLENFFGGVTMGTPDLDTGTMYYHQNYHLQPHHNHDYSGLYPTVHQQEVVKSVADATSALYLPSIGDGWMSNSYHPSNGNGNGGCLQSLSLSMSPGCSQSSSCVTISQQQVTPAVSAANVTHETVVVDAKKRRSEKLNHDNKQIVHRKSLDTFSQRTSQYRGVTRHRWTGRYEAHLWDNSCKKEGQTRKGRQGNKWGYDLEEKAARAYDLAAVKYWGPSTHINFPLENYQQELEEMKNMSRQEYVAHLRRRSSGFSKGASIYRGVTRHHQHGRWQARIGRVAGNKDLYLGTFSTQEDAAEAYDVAAIKLRGVNAVTNFDISRYNVERIIESNTLLSGELARRTKDPDPGPTNQEVLNQPQNDEPKAITNEPAATMFLETPSKSLNTWIPTATETAATPLIRSHMPMFAAWTDA
ncbi:AP2-like ethylene-responsive transcription factor ANT [Bidens hawaiensis]|uniref:AP2-like ethylene-responsive transcription factor ANT n=1 Tax=Bidens hawaiensis TaxID=980011 RepID=UPI00404A1F9F